MDAQFNNPVTQQREHLHIDTWKLFAGLAAFTISLRAQASTQILSALLANPEFSPTREPGEDETQAYARRACDFADALLTELNRREVAEQTKGDNGK
jgi:hypothetical protein